ncbi:4-hydroxy-tetrahydrodipicolinate synthase [Halothermothrix orenii]|uniref:4-hydroxy-tetrahydrodipicolinate synthase n=1 Tax=Halothermothrix orenii (strain H 168 / OCM 544 / DSM 9562) TaxID=373903 RepID=B8CWF6_HALOH|nr:4-hydroxy-tetrahydrodipicolinate synthase [Halothermothrix orenii]ACL69625.1 dihydrodipicolinate synthase [Halothermothrix orenii H 168]
MAKDFGEVLTAMVTPLDAGNAVDYSQARRLASYLIENGSDGLVVLGTTGETPTLTKTEKIRLLEEIVDEVGGRASIVAGTGSYSTEESIELTVKAEDIGVDGVMLVVPYYNKPPQDGLYNHFKLIAEKTSLPVMLYNVPGRTSRNIEPGTVKKLAQVDNIVAIKEASGNLEQVSTLARILPDDFYIYSGDDTLTLPVLSVGGHGVVSVASHLVGNKIKEMIRDFKDGRINKAIQLNKELGPIFSAMFLTTNPIPVKAALNMAGHRVGSLRPPLMELSHSQQEQLRQILEEYKLI